MNELNRAQAQIQVIEDEVSIIDSFPMMLTLVAFFVVTLFVFVIYPMAEAFASYFV